jgi:DNA-binding response OmpR family regulator
MLPDGDGLEVLTALRQHPSFALVPIIMVTAKAEAENVAKGLALGADAYVTKPYGSNALEYALRYVLQQELPDAAPAPAPKAEEKSVAATTATTQVSETLRTPEDVRALVTEAAIYREGDEARTEARWRAVKRVALFAGLALAVLQYYMMDTLYEIVSVQRAPILVPVASPDIRSTLELNAGTELKIAVAKSEVRFQ